MLESFSQTLLARHPQLSHGARMSMTWLADVDKNTFWAHHSWPSFGAPSLDEHALAVLPIFGFSDHGLGLPLDAEEVLGNWVVKHAAERLGPAATLRILPPVRFSLAPYGSGVFGVDPETAHDLVLEMSEGVKAAGFHKMLLFVGGPWNLEMADVASRDIRVSHGIQTFVTSLDGLGMSFHPTSPNRGRTQSAVAKILGTTPRPAVRADAFSDVEFAPGNFRQINPLPPGPPVDGLVFAERATERLASIMLEIVNRPALSGGTPRNATLAMSPAKEIPYELQSPIFPQAFRARYLPALQREDWERIPDKENCWVLISTGSIEQHGPHLPVGVDAILGQAWLEQILKKFPAGAKIYVAPPLTYGKSNEHLGFPGTLSISAKTLRRLIIAVATQLKAVGFRQIALLNSHGGNTGVLTYTLRELQSTLGIRAGLLGRPYRPDLSIKETEFGFHAGEWETSLMLAAASDLVRMDKAVSEYPQYGDAEADLRLNNAPAFLSWMTADISESGVVGDAKAATVEKGERWLLAGAEALAQKLAAL